MKCEVMKTEPLVWKFAKPEINRCPVCEKAEATTVVHYHIEYKSRTINTCEACSQLPCVEIMSMAMGFDINKGLGEIKL
jgi:hypothetical protein